MGYEHYQTRKMFKGMEDNVHYRKNIRIIGGIDLNVEKFTTEYSKKYIDKSSER